MKGNYYFLLLPLFFVLHGLTENLFIINYIDALILLVIYLIAEIIFFFLIRLIYKNSSKAAFITFACFAIFFFFGALQDFLKHMPFHFLSRYSFLLPLLAIGFVTMLLLLKRVFLGKKLALYLNILLAVLISFDLVTMSVQFVKHKEENFKISTTTIYKPNVYLVLLDEYAGERQLAETFHFDNSRFYDSLTELGFTIAKESSSNYTQTPWSMASLLSMSYLDELKNLDYSNETLKLCYKKISRSTVVSGFNSLGYKFFNYSIFDFKNESSLINKTLLKSGTALITSQTLWSRIKKDLYYNFLMNHMKHSSFYKNFIFTDLHNNELLYEKTSEQAAQQSSQPKFVYTHLMMPHFPYYYNSRGDLNDINSIEPKNMTNDSLYLEYLQYVNGQVLNLMKRIISSDENAIIILLSDHGYRYAKNDSLKTSNLSALYDPQKKITGYYQNISNVNIFRVLFNDLFKADLPLLPDKHFN